MKRYAVITTFDIYNNRKYYVYDRLNGLNSNEISSYQKAISETRKLNKKGE